MRRLLPVALAALWLSRGAAAEPWNKVLEVGAGYGSYSDPYGNSDFEFVRLTVERPSRQIWRFELSRAARFSDDGVGAAASFTRFLPAGWQVTAGASGGTGDVIYPDHQLDLTVTKSMLPKRNLFASALYTHSQSKQANRFDRLGLALEYRPGDHWVFTASGREEYGDPGDTTSRSGGLDILYGVYRKAYIGLGFDAGSVSYLLVSPTSALVDYDRTSIHGTLQVYLTRRSGFNVRLERERNDLYNLNTALGSYFREW